MPSQPRPFQRSERRPSRVPARWHADVTPLTDLEHAQSRTGPVRHERPVYVDLLPPCNAGCPAGADVMMTTSALLRHGPAYAGELLDGLMSWMARKGFGSLGDVRGMLSVPAGADQAAYERAGCVTAMRTANAGAYNPW